MAGLDPPSWTQQKLITVNWEAGLLWERNYPNERMDCGQSTSMAVCLSLVIIFYLMHTRFHRNAIITGGYDGDSHDDIIEFVPNKDIFSSVGQMIQARAWHALSVVPLQDYAPWCLGTTIVTTTTTTTTSTTTTTTTTNGKSLYLIT